MFRLKISRFVVLLMSFVTILIIASPQFALAQSSTTDVIETWNADRSNKTITNILGHKTRFTYDEQARLTDIIDPNGTQMSLKYLGTSKRPSSIITGSNTESPSITNFTFSAQGELVGVILPSGRALNPLFDNGTDRALAYEKYTWAQSVISSDHISNFYTKRSQNYSRRIVSALLEREQQTSTYDESGKVISLASQDGNLTSIQYDESGRVLSVIDNGDIATRFQYDEAGNLTQEQSLERGTTKYWYDSSGNMIKRTLADGSVTTRTFDELNRVRREVIKIRGEEKSVFRYAYDDCDFGVGRLCKVTGDGEITRFDYNALGQTTKVRTKYLDNEAVDTTNYRYNVSGRLTKVKYPSGLIVTYNYDKDGFVKSVKGHHKVNGVRETFLIADNLRFSPLTDRLSSLRFGNGVMSRTEYDNEQKISHIHVKNDNELLRSADYNFDTSGNITDIFREDDSLSQHFIYDGMNRLVEERRGNGGESIDAYTYDFVGNRIGKNNITLSYSADNRLAKVNDRSLSYNDNGNLLSDRNAKRAFEYNANNRLESFYKNDELRASYQYNAFGQRIVKTLHGGRLGEGGYRTLHASYTPDGWLLGEVGRDETGNRRFSRNYVWLGAKPIAQIESRLNRKGTKRIKRISYLHSDHLDTPRMATNENGQVVWSWEGDAFGKGKADLDPDGDGQKTVIRLRFPGQYHDRESGLFYNHHRDYDPKLGRYIQPDPIGLLAGVNRYAYVNGNPINSKDPNGLKTCTGSRLNRPDSYDCSSSGNVTCIGNCGDFYGTIITTTTNIGTGGGCSGDGCYVQAARTTQTTYVPFGHFYQTDNVICRDASVLNIYDRINIIRTYTVPRPTGLEVYLPDGTSTNLVIHPDFWNPGGFVESSFNHTTLCGRNVTTPNHIFEGTVERCLVEENGQLVMQTRGYGPDAGAFYNWLNDLVGPGTFDALDRNAFVYVGTRTPGC